MSGVITAVAASTAVGAYSANQSAKAQNRQARLAEENAERRYAIEAGVASQQMEEQQSIAFEKMTDVTRQFLQSQGQAVAIQAETGVSGKTAQRMEAVTRTKFSEAKGKVAQEVNTNVINIAQGMLASKVDTEALIAEARARRRNVGIDTMLGGVQGGVQGYMLGSSISNSGIFSKGTVASQGGGTQIFQNAMQNQSTQPNVFGYNTF